MEKVLTRIGLLYDALKEKPPKEIAGDPSLLMLAAELWEIYKQHIKTEKLTSQIIAREADVDEILFVRLLSSARRAQEIVAEAANK